MTLNLDATPSKGHLMKRIALALLLFAVGVVAAPRDARACTSTTSPIDSFDCDSTTHAVFFGDVANNSGYGIRLESNSGTTSVHAVDVTGMNSTDANSYTFYGVAAAGAKGIYQDITAATTGAAVIGRNLDTANASGTYIGSGVYGYSTVPFGAAVLGRATSGSVTTGVEGFASNSGASGVYGHNTGGGIGLYADVSGGTTSVGYAVYATATGTSSIGVYGTCSGTTCQAAQFAGNVSVTGTLTCGSGCSSDRTLKKNIEPLTSAEALSKVLALHGVTYEWKDPDAALGQTAGRQIGVIAQDVATVMPTWVHPNEKGTLSVQPNEREELALLVESVRALHEENAVLRDRVQLLEGKRSPFRAGFDIGLAGMTFVLVMVGTAGVLSRRRRRSEHA